MPSNINYYYYDCYYDSCLIRFRLDSLFRSLAIHMHTHTSPSTHHTTRRLYSLLVVYMHVHRQQWIFCFQLNLVNCWLHARQHRILYWTVSRFFIQLLWFWLSISIDCATVCESNTNFFFLGFVYFIFFFFNWINRNSKQPFSAAFIWKQNKKR